VVLDTNVLVRAAAKVDNIAGKLLRIIILGGPHCLLVSPFILNEVSRVLAYRRLQLRWGLTAERIQTLVSLLGAAGETVQLGSLERVVPADPDDDPIVQTAVRGQAGVICTRDTHLFHPDVVEYCGARGVRVMDDIQLYRLLTEGPRGS
jgi:putative PIN family toxin of toxin-antitoxin system